MGEWRPSSSEDLARGSGLGRARANIAALKLRKSIMERGLAPEDLTDDDRKVLARYGGWGGTSVQAAFGEPEEPSWKRVADDLRSVLTPEEWESAQGSTPYAHWTDFAVAREIWSALIALGLPTDRVIRVLEPAVGAGVFLAAAPAELKIRWTCVDADPLAAWITAHVWPEAQVLAMPLQASWLPPGTFDLVLSNVPFSRDERPYDPVDNRAKLNLHNYFGVKKNKLVRAGGLVAWLTSRYAMDVGKPRGLLAVSTGSDLVAAVRLPNGTMTAAADTSAPMDLIITRRRGVADPPKEATQTWTEVTNDIGEKSMQRGNPRAWIGVTATDINWISANVNDWWLTHPGAVIGKMRIGRGLYGANELMIDPPEGISVPEALRASLADLVSEALRCGLSWSAAEESDRPVTHDWLAGANGRKPGSVHLDDAHGLVWINPATRQAEPWAPPLTERQAADVAAGKAAAVKALEKRQGIVAALIGLRDLTAALLLAEKDGDEDSDARGRLRSAYDEWAAEWGPINGAAVWKGDDDEPTYRAQHGGFVIDPDYPAICGLLETLDPVSQEWEPGGLLAGPVLARRPAPVIETPMDALNVCLDRHGRVLADVIDDLGGAGALRSLAADRAVFLDPATGEWASRARYLSGNVREKLAIAVAAHEATPVYDANIEDLTAIVPPTPLPGEIRVQPAASWLPKSVIHDFAKEVLGYYERSPFLNEDGQWSVDQKSASRTRKSREFDHSAMSARDQFGHSLRSQATRIVVTDAMGNKNKLESAQLTSEVLVAQAMLESRFAAWVFEDEDRSAKVLDAFDEKMNSFAEPAYDGSYLSLPWLNSQITPRQFQRDVAARALQSGARVITMTGTVLANSIWEQWIHAKLSDLIVDAVVGSGKTLIATIIACEARRTGAADLVIWVCPNAVLGQTAAMIRQAAPLAQVLVYDEAYSGAAGRTRMAATARAADWDIILIPESMFTRFPLGEGIAEQYIAERVALAERNAIGESASPKKTAKLKNRARAKAEDQVGEDKRDLSVINLETLLGGRTAIFVIDEVHNYKSLELDTKADGVRSPTSQKATHLSLVKEHSDRLRGVASQLNAEGYGSVDNWLGTFTALRTRLEVSPTGSGFRQNSRRTRVLNVQQLRAWYAQHAAVVTSEMLQQEVHVPAIAGGERRIVVTPASSGLRRLNDQLLYRAANLRFPAKPGDDNMLAIIGEAQKGALHLGLLDQGPCPDGGKITTAASVIAEMHHRYGEDRYDGSDRLGSAILVFCDLGTPKSPRSPYHRLRRGLMERGVPAREIAFIHDAKNQAQRRALLASVRDGRVRILIGSTQKMGVGVNVQTRVRGLVHIDPPRQCRPCDLEQREGRALRQGNLNAEVEIVVCVTEESFDAFIWGLITGKQLFIDQFYRSDATVEMEDVPGVESLQFSDIAAHAAGNELAAELAKAEMRLAGLDIQASLVRRGVGAAQREAAAAAEWIAKAKRAQRDLCYRSTPLVNGSSTRSIVTWKGVEVEGQNGYYWTCDQFFEALGQAIVQWREQRITRRIEGNSMPQAIPFGRLEGVGPVNLANGFADSLVIDFGFPEMPWGPLGVNVRAGEQAGAHRLDWRGIVERWLEEDLPANVKRLELGIEGNQGILDDANVRAAIKWDGQPDYDVALAEVRRLRLEAAELSAAEGTKDSLHSSNPPEVDDWDLWEASLIDLVAETPAVAVVEPEPIPEAEPALPERPIQPARLRPEDPPKTTVTRSGATLTFSPMRLFDMEPVERVAPARAARRKADLPPALFDAGPNRQQRRRAARSLASNCHT